MNGKHENEVNVERRLSMKIINNIEGFRKLNKSERNHIQIGINRLKERIETYQMYNQSFNSIGMDDKLIHDAYIADGKRFFLYKCRIKSISLRLLYTFDDNDNLIIVSYVIKKSSSKEYFNKFEHDCQQYMRRV